MPQRQGRDMKLKVVGCRQVYNGRNKAGDEYAVYEIDAQRPQDGQLIEEKLRSFTALPIGQEGEFTVTPFDSEKHGRSYTLYPKGGSRKTSAIESVNELRVEVTELYERVRALTQRVVELEGPRNRAVEAAVRAEVAAPPAQAPGAELDAAFGEEPPF